MSDRVRNVVIVGGGAAGWLTAGVLAAEHGTGQGEAVRITLVESPDVKTLGVGRAGVRGQIIEVLPENWGIGGTPASGLRAVEIAERAADPS